jgi:hypothetical protein
MAFMYAYAYVFCALRLLCVCVCVCVCVCSIVEGCMSKKFIAIAERCKKLIITSLKKTDMQYSLKN